MATVRRLIGNIKGPKGDAATIGVGTVSTGDPGTAVEVTNSGTSSAATFNFAIPRGATGAPGAPGVTDYATTESAGLVRVGDDFKINSGNGTLSMKNLFTTASTMAKMVSEEAFAISLGKIAKAVDWVVDNAPNFFNKNTDIVDGFDSALTDKALSANAGKTLKTRFDSLNDSITTSYVGNIESSISGATPSISNITRVGKNVNFGLRFTSLNYSSTGRTTIGNIPSEFRPLGQRFCMGYMTINSTRYPAMFLINPTGAIQYDPFSSGTVVQLEVCGNYMIGD